MYSQALNCHSIVLGWSRFQIHRPTPLPVLSAAMMPNMAWPLAWFSMWVMISKSCPASTNGCTILLPPAVAPGLNVYLTPSPVTVSVIPETTQRGSTGFDRQVSPKVGSTRPLFSDNQSGCAPAQPIVAASCWFVGSCRLTMALSDVMSQGAYTLMGETMPTS